jgi:hypothetical protein
VGDGEKLLTYLNSALKVLSGLDIFPRGTKKKLNFVDQCYPFLFFADIVVVVIIVDVAAAVDIIIVVRISERKSGEKVAAQSLKGHQKTEGRHIGRN